MVSTFVLCKRFHSCLQFDPFFGGSIAICASWIHLHLVRGVLAVDLFLGSSIDICATWIYLNEVQFIFARFD